MSPAGPGVTTAYHSLTTKVHQQTQQKFHAAISSEHKIHHRRVEICLPMGINLGLSGLEPTTIITKLFTVDI